ncbi:hypothetical protein MP638_007015 [Amoeboaphelidium occidentale]|nr:hypothetical protein MP638_007015 [Amoeboaphelidium occidentale]
MSSSVGPGRIRPFQLQDCNSKEWMSHHKHFILLTKSGKPVYTLYGNEESMSSLTGIISLLLGRYEQDQQDDVLKSIECINGSRIMFLSRNGLYYCLYNDSSCSTSTSTSTSSATVLKEYLVYFHLMVVALTTQKQLKRVSPNFDLRRLLGGTENVLDYLLTSLDREPGFMLQSVNSCRLPQTLRHSVCQSLLQQLQHSSILFCLLMVKYQLVGICRHHSHHVHPIDLLLLLSVVQSSSTFKSVPETWLPLCLPKFNSDGYLYVYISFLVPQYPSRASDLCLLIVSNDSQSFQELRLKRQRLVEQMQYSGALFLLQDQLRRNIATTSQSSASEFGMRYYLYKSKKYSQYIESSSSSDDYDYEQQQQDGDGSTERVEYLKSIMGVRDLLTNGSLLQQQQQQQQQHQQNEKNKNGGDLVFVSNERISVLGWIDSAASNSDSSLFEVYCVFGPLVTKGNAVHSVNKLLKWIKKEEENLFITNAPTMKVT